MAVELPLILQQQKGADKRGVIEVPAPIGPAPAATMQLTVTNEGGGKVILRGTETLGSFDRMFRRLQSWTAGQSAVEGVEYRVVASYQGSTNMLLWKTGDDDLALTNQNIGLQIGPDWPVGETHTLEQAYRHLRYRLVELLK